MDDRLSREQGAQLRQILAEAKEAAVRIAREESERAIKEAVDTVVSRKLPEWRDDILRRAEKTASAELWGRMPQRASRAHTPIGHKHPADAGGGGLIHYDYVVDSQYTGTEGATVTLATGSTAIIYSTIQAAIDAGDAANADISIRVNEGTYNEDIEVKSTWGTDHSLIIVGEGKDKVFVGTAAANANVALTLSKGGSGAAYYHFYGMTFRGGTSSGWSVTGADSSIKASFFYCDFVRQVGYDSSEEAMFIECRFFSTGGYVTTGFTPDDGMFIGCTFQADMNWSGNLTNFYFGNCDFGGVTITVSGGADLEDVTFSNCNFRSTASGVASFTVNGVSATIASLAFVGCIFPPPGTNGVIYFQTHNGCNGVVIADNEFNRANASTNPYITSGDSQTEGVCIVGNNFKRDGSGNYVEDSGGVSIKGQFKESVFGPNTPPDFDIDIDPTSSNNLYIGTRSTLTGNEGTTQVPGTAVGPHAILDNSVHSDSAAGSPTKGSIIAGSGTEWDDLAVGTDGHVLTADSAQALGVKWAAGGAGGAHDHTTGDGSGVLTNDEHDGYSKYTEIAAPGVAGANDLRVYAVDDAGETALGLSNSASEVKLTPSDWTDLTDGGATTLHTHSGGTGDDTVAWLAMVM